MDGGLRKWIEEKRPTVSGSPPTPYPLSPGYPAPSMKSNLLCTYNQIIVNINTISETHGSNEMVVDARSAARCGFFFICRFMHDEDLVGGCQNQDPTCPLDTFPIHLTFHSQI